MVSISEQRHHQNNQSLFHKCSICPHPMVQFVGSAHPLQQLIAPLKTNRLKSASQQWSYCLGSKLSSFQAYNWASESVRREGDANFKKALCKFEKMILYTQRLAYLGSGILLSDNMRWASHLLSVPIVTRKLKERSELHPPYGETLLGDILEDIKFLNPKVQSRNPPSGNTEV